MRAKRNSRSKIRAIKKRSRYSNSRPERERERFRTIAREPLFPRYKGKGIKAETTGKTRDDRKSSIRPLESIGIIRLAPLSTRGRRERSFRTIPRGRRDGHPRKRPARCTLLGMCVMVGGKFHSRNYHD